MTVEDARKYINALSKRSSEQGDSGDAMRFAQAACNVANAMCAMIDAEQKKSRFD